MHRLLHSFFKTCPKTGRITGVQTNVSRWYFPILGVAAFVWLLIRVIPKPSRVGYPCIKIAAPIAFSFALYITGLFTSALFYRKARKYLTQSRHLMASLASLTAIFLFAFSIMQDSKPANAIPNFTLEPPNTPMGEGVGIYPGRVAWVHNADATDENCQNRTNDYWSDEDNTDQAVVNQMVSDGLQAMTGEATDAAAWDAIFRYHNANHGKGDVGYTSGETFAIKINLNGLGNVWGTTPPQNINTSPQLCHAILDQLVNVADVAQGDIYIGDTNFDMDNTTYNKCNGSFPDVNYYGGNTGRTDVVRSSSKVFVASDGSTEDYLPQSYVDAAYLINMPVLKKHHRSGITLGSKNHFGSIAAFTSGAWHLHPSLISPDATGQPDNGEYGAYRGMVDIMGHEHLGGKTILHLVDGIWGSPNWGHPPVKYRMTPFNDDWPNSLFFSQDPVAIASVCFDFLYEEYDEDHPTEGSPATGNKGPFPRWPGVDDYLHQAADPANWPDDTQYDPEDDGTLLTGMGAHEHWNNAANKQYTQNLGGDTGIELVTISGSSAVNPDQIRELPAGFVLSQNYPNPFNPSTEIQYQLQESSYLEIGVYQVNGQLVRNLFKGYQDAGTHTRQWNGRSESGLPVSSGVYVYRIIARHNGGVFQQSNKMVLSR
ncbi:DUF362 domain-containing protein [candidate division KSB1 bacterium]|nr:DUF362 domain-containing protein [candidate division KSB1 bacterium]